MIILEQIINPIETKTENEQETIDQFNFLGFKIYKRVRIREWEINFPVEEQNHSYLGLSAFSRYPDLLLKNTIGFKLSKYNDVICETFVLIILQLHANKVIKIYRFWDKKRYLGKLISTDFENYRLKLEMNGKSDDLLTNILLDTIKQFEASYRLKSDLSLMLKHIFDRFLGKGNTYSNAGYTFMCQLLKAYDQNYKWFDLNLEKKLFGIQKVLDPEVRDDDKMLEILRQSDLRQLSKKIALENIQFGRLRDEIQEMVNSEFRRRKPND